MEPVPGERSYTLTEEDLGFCTTIGTRREVANREANKRSLRFALRRTDQEINVQGVIGELAFLRMFALPEGLLQDTRCRNVYDDTFDAVMTNGWTVDVKTTTVMSASLRVAEWKRRNPPSVYAFQIYDPLCKRVRCLGFIDALLVLVPGNLVSLAGGKRYFEVPRSRLVPWEKIRAEVLVERRPFF